MTGDSTTVITGIIVGCAVLFNLFSNSKECFIRCEATPLYLLAAIQCLLPNRMSTNGINVDMQDCK